MTSHRDPPTRVVGVALLRRTAAGAEVLAARRTHPPEVAGRWELPGGKARPGESLEDAARRELVEELGVHVEVTGVLPGVQDVAPGLTLEVVVAELVAGEVVPTEHSEVRWLTAQKLDGVDWLEPDRPFVEQVARLLSVDPA
jgi:8-oxo-dGTP diphosphatase